MDQLSGCFDTESLETNIFLQLFRETREQKHRQRHATQITLFLATCFLVHFSGVSHPVSGAKCNKAAWFTELRGRVVHSLSDLRNNTRSVNLKNLVTKRRRKSLMRKLWMQGLTAKTCCKPCRTAKEISFSSLLLLYFHLHPIEWKINTCSTEISPSQILSRPSTRKHALWVQTTPQVQTWEQTGSQSRQLHFENSSGHLISKVTVLQNTPNFFGLI